MKYFTFLFLTLISFQLFSINPQKEYKLTPATFSTEYHEIKVETKDLCFLNTWVIEPKNEEYEGATILVAGSDAGNMGYTSLLATQLAAKGFRVVMFDYRGFGDSTDFQFNKMNMYHDEYVDDFKTMVTWCKKEYPGERLGVMAFSMGGVLAVLSYEDTPYDFLVTEGMVCNLEKQKRRIKKKKGINLHLPFSAHNHRPKLNQLDIPIMSFAGKWDKITSVADLEKLKTLKPDLELHSFDGGHLEGMVSLGITDYVHRIERFIQLTDEELF